MKRRAGIYPADFKKMKTHTRRILALEKFY
jgi:hypothetical protein